MFRNKLCLVTSVLSGKGEAEELQIREEGWSGGGKLCTWSGQGDA